MYFDNSATTKVLPQVADAMLHMLTSCYGNPSSLHAMGYEAQRMTDRARRQAAHLLGCEPKNLTFTSGATEANNLALLGAARRGKRKGRKIVSTAFEHASVLAPLDQLEQEGFSVVRVAPGLDGNLDPDAFVNAVDEDTFLASCMMVNNETGAVQPIENMIKQIRRKAPDALIHCDAVQAFGKLKWNTRRLDVDMLTVTAHKIHGPKGTGCLYLRDGLHLAPRQLGGAQERGFRPGTENTAGIVGFGLACELMEASLDENRRHVEALRDTVRDGLSQFTGIRLNSPPDAIPYILNISVPGIRSEIMMHYLEQHHLYVSSGSACAKGEKSHVLRSMGLDDKTVDSALRISFSHLNTQEEALELVKWIGEGMKAIRR